MDVVQRVESSFICNTPRIKLVNRPSNIVATLLSIWDNSKLTEEAMMNKYGCLYPTSDQVKWWIRYRDWETDRKSTRLNSSHSAKSRMPSSA